MPYRRRHIRCDQARPYCMRCVKSNRVCEGYLDSNSRTLPGSQSQVIVRKNQRIVPAEDSRLFKIPGYETMLFCHQKDLESFQSFVFTVEAGDTLLHDDTSSMTPQYAQTAAHSSAIRQMCCGIGALQKSFHPVVRDSMINEDYHSALEHYGRGVRAVFSMKPTTISLPSAILASLLFTTFEFMAGNMDVAFKHHNYAVAIMKQYLDLRMEEEGVALENLAFSGMERALFDSLERMNTLPWVLGFGKGDQVKTTSPARDFPHGCRHRLRMIDIPERFTSTHQATTWWHFMQHNMVHALHCLKFPEVSEDQRTAAFVECADLMKTWYSSFTPLLREAKHCRSTQGARWSQAMILESLYIETLSALYFRHKQDSNVLPDVTPIYRDLIRQSAQMVRDSALNGLQTLERENSITRPIAFVLYKCQDPDIVQEAIDVLASVVGGMNMSYSLLHLFTSERRTVPLTALDKAWGWYLTCTGCSSGAHVFDDIP
ncbi:C6 zinc finger domain-containing protein [Colletotrichum truncatum]|uniref:C6 zinc finger domain-containing protein n=1 Tax=Colletotrichum truncatum TaxID=5467 RepID=A0ACC3Z115_COLTU|nr:C6 zinc finger domain-containing protein [Colletotrichum truncatum]XP_036588813.1 C6 zinc finger domain-containing protein [Colletotrichum truncatum]KAF6780631.1 C6 zinc finger domain-containing protein [Colletotrichum truncatum]KAF6800455.1 C6 zinc finger domain-containing protein [Colletotrichum truncatum]